MDQTWHVSGPLILTFTAQILRWQFYNVPKKKKKKRFRSCPARLNLLQDIYINGLQMQHTHCSKQPWVTELVERTYWTTKGAGVHIIITSGCLSYSGTKHKQIKTKQNRHNIWCWCELVCERHICWHIERIRASWPYFTCLGAQPCSGGALCPFCGNTRRYDCGHDWGYI